MIKKNKLYPFVMRQGGIEKKDDYTPLSLATIPLCQKRLYPFVVDDYTTLSFKTPFRAILVLIEKAV